MKFQLSRTSQWVDEESPPPIDDARVTTVDTDERTAFNEIWKRRRFFIEISTLEELVEFLETHGTVVMGPKSIEIYDDYRE